MIPKYGQRRWAMSLLHSLDLRAMGLLSSRTFLGQRLENYMSHLGVSREVEVESCQRGPLNHLELDPLDGRYLLAAAGDATVALYDLEDAQRTLDPVSGKMDDYLCYLLIHFGWKLAVKTVTGEVENGSADQCTFTCCCCCCCRMRPEE